MRTTAPGPARLRPSSSISAGSRSPCPAASGRVSPWTDLTLSGDSLVARSAVDPLISRLYLAEPIDADLPPGHDRADPLASSLFANLSGLPLTLIQVGTAETLLDDSTRLAAAMGAAGIAVPGNDRDE